MELDLSLRRLVVRLAKTLQFAGDEGIPITSLWCTSWYRGQTYELETFEIAMTTLGVVSTAMVVWAIFLI
jgi:hypothetical protein